MKGNFLRITLRIFSRNKSYAILNLFCLSFGLTCAILGLLYVIYMTGFDKFQRNYNRLFEVEALVTYFNGERFAKEPLSASLDELIKKNVPEFESVVRIANGSGSVIYGDKSFNETGIYADTNFFDAFSFPFVSYKSSDLLSDLNVIIITERLANKLFQTTDCSGKMLVLKDGDRQKAFKVTGVIRDVPAQSTIRFDFVIPFTRFLADNNQANEVGASATRIWVLARKNSNINALNSKIKDLIKHQDATLNQELFLFPLKEKNLYSYAGGRRVWDRMQSVVIVSGISLAILLIACFNFINLSVAQNINRYREVGIKKAFGAGRTTIIIQFIGETSLLVAAGMVIAIALAELLINAFNTLFNGSIRLSLPDPVIIISLITIALFTIFTAGMLPAIYLSSPDPVSILRERRINGHSFSLLRRSLIVFQFAIPVVLIICMMIIKNQEIFVNKYDIGVERNNLLIINNTPNLEKHRETLKNELLNIPGIDAVSFTNCIPTRGARVSNEVKWTGKDETEKLHFWCINSDFSYNRVVSVKMTAGRFFDKSFPSDSGCYIINDVAAKIMKMDNPIGKEIVLNGLKGTVIGVFKDFHTVDLRGPFTPTIISISPNESEELLVKFSQIGFSSVKAKVGEIYKKFETEIPYQPELFNDLPDFAGLKVISDLVGLAFVIALALACLGLFGLASFTAQWRSREIGIRKVSGAITSSVMILLINKYSRWLLVSFLISLPVAFLVGKFFLSRFYFHSPMPWWAFAAGPGIAFAVAVLAVSLKSWKVASKNPVDSLRYD